MYVPGKIVTNGNVGHTQQKKSPTGGSLGELIISKH